MREFTEREPGADQALLKLNAFADANAMVVEVSTVAARRGEQVIAHRIVNHRLHHYAFVRERYRYRVLRKAVQEIGGAIERIDDPLEFRFAGCTAFLG